MSDATKVLQTGVDTGDGSTYPQPVVVVDAAGNPIDLTKANGAAITSVTAVALAAGAAPTATLADGVLTLGIPAGAKGGNGDPGPAGVGVKSISLTKNSDNAITGGTWVGTDDKSHAFTVA